MQTVELTQYVVQIYPYITRKADRDYKRALMEAVDIDQHRLLSMAVDETENMSEEDFLKKAKMRINMAAHEVARDLLVLGQIQSVKTRKGVPVTVSREWMDALPSSDFETLHSEVLKVKMAKEEEAKK